MGEVQVLGPRGVGGRAFGLARHEGFGGDVVAEEFGVDQVKRGWDEGRDERFGRLDGESV